MIDARTRLPVVSPVTGSRDIETLSRLMDAWFVIPGVGWRFGLNTLLDLIPGFGDAVTSMISFAVVATAARRGIARVTLLRMALNVVIYAVIGIVPWLGDLVGTWFKPNMRNMALLRREVDAPDEMGRHRKADTVFVVTVLSGLALFLISIMAVIVWLMSKVFHIFF